MTSAYRREHLTSPRNDEIDMLNATARGYINNAAAFFEGLVEHDDITPSEGERLALKRAMARFVIDSGIASAQGWISGT